MEPIFAKCRLNRIHDVGLNGSRQYSYRQRNGIDTSPVIRGIWVLENILGTPPSPPPARRRVSEPDIRGATTIRDQLDKHREVETCYECHRKIDPLGFALENYDPIGGWRDRYPRGQQEGPLIDASGELPNGEHFSGPGIQGGSGRPGRSIRSPPDRKAARLLDGPDA